MRYTIALGNPFDGIELFGVFEDAEAAVEYADIAHATEDYRVVPIYDVGEA